jgi:hypothetical protein
MTGELASGPYQFVPDQGLVFAGRVLFNDGSRVLRFSGGDATGYKKQFVLDATQKGKELHGVEFDKVVFEQYRVSKTLVRELVNRGDELTFLHIDICRELMQDRLDALDHPKADECNPPYDRPADKDYQDRRDRFLASQGVQVIYIGGDVRDRCEFTEDMLGLKPAHDYILYDFDVPPTLVHERFLSGGDSPRPIDEVHDVLLASIGL